MEGAKPVKKVLQRIGYGQEWFGSIQSKADRSEKCFQDIGKRSH